MRKILYIFAACVLTACTNFLNVQPQGYVIPTTDEEFASVIETILRDIEGGEDEFIIGNMEKIIRLEGCADNLDANVKTGNNVPSYAGEEINSMQHKYRNAWPTVKDCNIVIENLEGRTGKTARGALSAAYAIKGAVYYNLIRDYCEPWEAGKESTQLGLPIVDRFDIEAMPARASLLETCQYAVSLFDKALALDPQDKHFLFTEWVIKAFKAKMLFWMEDWDACEILCDDIMQNSGFRITPRAEYDAMINSEKAAKGEVIIRSHINDSSELDWYFSVVKKYLSSRPASAKFVRLFGDEPSKDVRYTSSLDRKRQNIKVTECKIRLSEILLMSAECACHKNRTDKALALVNQLRENRIEDVQPLTMATLPAVREGNLIKVDALGNELTPLLQAIFDERQKELFIEGDRWFELKRNGRPEWWIVSNGLKYTTKEYLYTAPIYKTDVDINPEMKQNPGYEK